MDRYGFFFFLDRYVLMVDAGLPSQGLFQLKVKMEEGKKKEIYTPADDCISFYCIHYLITIILIGKKYIYTNKLNLITGIFQMVRKQWATYI